MLDFSVLILGNYIFIISCPHAEQRLSWYNYDRIITTQRMISLISVPSPSSSSSYWYSCPIVKASQNEINNSIRFMRECASKVARALAQIVCEFASVWASQYTACSHSIAFEWVQSKRAIARSLARARVSKFLMRLERGIDSSRSLLLNYG